ncbi:MAG: phosphoribosylformylglycinamidine synthase subunit PurQ, partial [Spirochaetota bacterium]
KFAFEYAGGKADILHVNDLIDNPSRLKEYQIFVFPGGFSYGDDTGSGKAMANRIRNNLSEYFAEFIARDVLVLGICNGFQVMASLGIVPGYSPFGNADVALERNSTDRYQCRWVDLIINKDSKCVFTKGIERLHVPVAHGEGNFYASSSIIARIEDGSQDVMHYAKGSAPAKGEFPFNPNGAMHDVAAVCDPTGRIMGMMPHPERNILFTQRDDFTARKEDILRAGGALPEESEGILLFRNAVNYFK